MIEQSKASTRLAEYLTVGQAAEMLGVSPWTLRNWDKAGKLKPTRHPKNGYRIYRHEDLRAILQIDSPAKRDSLRNPDWRLVADSDHFVQFYESDEFLVSSVAGFIGAALEAGENGIVVATRGHRMQIQKLLKERGLNPSVLRASGKFVVLDAAQTLSKFMVDDLPDPRRFLDVVGTTVTQMTAGGQRLRAFGEMVALLWSEGNRAGAIRLEELWNDLSKHFSFALFCAYPMNGFTADEEGGSIADICSCHSRVIPAESFAALTTEDDRRREIARLQQKAQALEAEIAHREEVERALARREGELADLVENAIEGLHQVGADGKILWANKAELNLLGYRAEEYIGHHIAEFHVDQDVICEILAKLGRGESLYDQPARLRCKDGFIKHVMIYSNACFENGAFLYTRCFTRDVTETKMLEEERRLAAVRELEALQGEANRKQFLLNAISHDLRTPLNGLLLQTNLAQLSFDNGDTATLAESLSQIRASVPAACNLLDAIVRSACDNAAHPCEGTERFALDELLARATSACRAAAQQKGLSLKSVAPAGLEISADRITLERILLNLLDNAIKFTETGGVTLTAETSKSNISIHIDDTGPGIAAQHLPRVFDEFYQAANPSRDKSHGFGLGLSVVRKLARPRGWDVTVRSTPGKGSRFTIVLPHIAAAH